MTKPASLASLPPAHTFSWLASHTLLGKCLRLLGYTYASWVLLCCLVLLPLLNYATGKLYQAQTGRSLSYDLITFNPFSLNLSLHNLRDNNPDGSLFWHLVQGDINIAFWRSLFTLTPGLDELSLQGLEANIAQNAKGEFNFDDIVQHIAQNTAASSAPESAGQEPLPGFFISRTRLHIHRIHYSEARRNNTFAQALNNLRLELDSFSTVKEAGQPFRLNARLDELGTIAWSGEVSLAGHFSQGQLQLENIPLAPAVAYLQEQLGFNLHSGAIDASGDYLVSWKDELQYQVENGHIYLNQLALEGYQTADLQLQLPSLTAENLQLDSRTQSLNLAALHLDSLVLHSWSNGDHIGALHALEPNAAASQQAAPTHQEEASSNWEIRVDTIALNEGEVHWLLGDIGGRDVNLRHLGISLSPLDLSGEEAAQLSLSSELFDNSRILLQGEINPVALNGQLSAELHAIPLDLANSQLQPFLAATITQGLLSTRAQIQLQDGAPTHITSQGSVKQFVLEPRALQEEAVSFSQLQWHDAQIDLSKSHIHAPYVSLSKLDGRFVIGKDGKTNIEALLNTPEAAANTEASSDGSDAWTIALDKFALDNAAFRFHDASLTPQFTAAVQNFSGELNNLSSDTNTIAPFAFKGNVDGYAPVSLIGAVQPFASDAKVKAELTFKHLDLGGLSGYSSTYAGWRIERGQLNADLNYHLEDGRILGDNHIEMDKLQLGERVRSAQAMDIPLRLALALITDSKGLAVLDMQVSGNTDDPQFDISKILLAAVKNTFNKIVSAPFRLLASLVGSEEELEFLPFNSGSGNVLATANRRLDSLQQALEKRPQLRIELQGYFDPVSDKRGLQLLQANQLLASQGVSAQDIKQKNKHWEAAVKNAYYALPDSEGKNTKLTVDEMQEAWLVTFPINDAELQQLALTRASNAKQHLVQKFTADPARIFINGSNQCTEEDPSKCRRRAVKIGLDNSWDMAALAQ